MFKIIVISKRDNPNVPFFFELPESDASIKYFKYFRKQYTDRGYFLSMKLNYSEDKCTAIAEYYWSSKLNYKEFLCDNNCYEFRESGKQYELKNNIVSEIIEIGEGDFHMIKKPEFDVEMGLGELWKKYESNEYFKDLTIPNDWETLEDFVEWYVNVARMPLMVPNNAQVMMSDDAVSICIFRKGRYQVEFYLEYPDMYIRKHSHPRMEVITLKLGGGSIHPPDYLGMSRKWGETSVKLLPGEYHGGDMGLALSSGFCILALQKWENIDEMLSASVQWKGEIQGPLQAKIINENRINATLTDNYADVTGK